MKRRSPCPGEYTVPVGEPHRPLTTRSRDVLPQPEGPTTNDVPAFGWSGYAERVNGRFAMVGFVAVLLIEVLSGDTFLHWAGLLP